MKKSEKDKKSRKKTNSKKEKDKGEIKLVREIKDKKIKVIKEEKPKEEGESELENDLVPEQLESMSISNTSNILRIARNLAFQPAPTGAEEPLETMIADVPGRESEEKSSKTYVEFKKDYETGRGEESGEEEKNRTYDTSPGVVSTGKREETRGPLPFERSEQKPGEAVTFREDYRERKEEEDKEERKYDSRVKVKKL